MKITYSDSAKRSEEFPRLQQVSQRLPEIVGASERFVSAEWDILMGANGMPRYVLELKDSTEQAAVSFDEEQLKSPLEVQFQMLHLWSELLQARTDRLLQARLIPAGVE